MICITLAKTDDSNTTIIIKVTPPTDTSIIILCIYYKSMEVGTIIGGKAYYIVYQSDPGTYNNNLPIINKMLSSLHLP
jgi:hypothetical protein